MRRFLALALLIVPSLAPAQETKKFDLKELEQKLAPAPIYYAKGQVADNEVILAEEPLLDRVQAVYTVRVEAKKVVEFYRTKLSVEPAKEGEDLGAEKFTFAPKHRQGEPRVFRVVVEPVDEGRATMITVTRRKATDED